MRFLKPGLIQAVCLTIALSGCGGEDARKASYLEKGKTYYEEGNYDKAKIEFRNVLQIDPKYAEGYYMVGLLEEKKQNYQPAFANYLKAVELDPKHVNAQAKLGRLYLMSGDVVKAKETLDKMTTLAPNSIEGKVLKLLIMARESDNGAIPYAISLLTEDKTQLEVIQVLSTLYIKGNEQDKGIKVLREGIANIPDNVNLRLQLASIYAKDKDYDNAEILLKDVIALNPDKMEYQASLASFYAQRNQVDKAEEVLQKLISLDPSDETRYLLLVNLQVQRKSVGEGEKTLLSAIEKLPDGVKLRFALADLYKAMKSEKAYDVYREIANIKGFESEGLKARNELATHALAKKDLDGASILVKEVLDNNPRDNDALLLKGRIAAIRKDFDTAISAFRTVVKDQPALIEAVSYLATTHIQNNEPELAGEVLARGVDEAPNNPKAYIYHATFLEKKGDIDKSEKVVDKLLALLPANLDGLKMKVKFASFRRDMNEVKLAIEKIKSAHPKNSDGYQLMGDYYAGLKQYPQALAEYESGLAASKSLLPSLASIVKLYLNQKQFDNAVTRLNTVIKEQPENAIPYELMGEVYLAQQKFAQAEEAIRKAISVNSKWSLPYTSLAGIYLAQKNMQGAIKTYLDAIKNFPEDTQLMAKLAQVYEAMDNHEEAIAVYQKVLDIDSENALAANNMAVMLADKKGDAASLQKAKELAMRFETSTNPGFLDTLGWIYYKLGEVEKAVPILEKVVINAKNIPIFQYHLGMAYYKTGNKDAAKTHLSKALEGSEKFQGREEAEQVIKTL